MESCTDVLGTAPKDPDLVMAAVFLVAGKADNSEPLQSIGVGEDIIVEGGWGSHHTVFQ